MIKSALVLALAFVAACSTSPRIVSLANDRIASIEDVVADLAGADVVALGEAHGVADVHRTHQRLIERVYRRRPNMVIVMEMFERDVQGVLLQYLTDQIDEEEFLANSRPWKNYAVDYRPVVEFAKRNGVVVLAGNAPRELAREVVKHGVQAVLGNPNVARETTAPEDAYWDAFVDRMKGHDGAGGIAEMRRFYQAQCLKDDTMAETVIDHLEACADPDPLVVLICGHMHSDYGRGAVQRILDRGPDLDARVLSVELVEDMGAGYFSSLRSVADYVIVAARPEPKIGVIQRKSAETEDGDEKSGTGMGEKPGS